LRKIFRPLGFEPHPAEEYDSATSLIAAVEAGRGVALVPSSLRCLAGPRLRLLPLKPAPPPVTVGALALRSASTFVTRFIAASRSAAMKTVLN
jgi:DNA-binding transcriptional LysR family regulator